MDREFSAGVAGAREIEAEIRRMACEGDLRVGVIGSWGGVPVRVLGSVFAGEAIPRWCVRWQCKSASFFWSALAGYNDVLPLDAVLRLPQVQ